MSNLAAVPAHTPAACSDRAVGAAPPDDQHVRVAVGIVDLELRDVGRDARDLLRAQPRHQVVVLRVVRDVPGAVRLLEPADAMLETRRSRHRPRPRERLLVAQIWQELSLEVRLGRKRRRDIGERRHVRQEPRLGAVCEIRVGEEIHRRPVLERDARSLDRSVEAVRRRLRGDDRNRRLAVAPEEHHQQVGLLGLRRHAGRRACTLDVADEERQLEHDRKADRLGLEHDTRAGGRRHGKRATEGGADRSTRCGDLVLRLERPHAEVLVVRELLEDRARGRDRIRTEEERQARELRRGDQPI